MGIQSTRYITRDDALERVEMVAKLYRERDFRGLEQLNNNEEISPTAAIRTYRKQVKKYTKEAKREKESKHILGQIMDLPFFRDSIFDNYLIVSEEEVKEYYE